MELFIRTFPVLVFVKMSVFLVMGVYRGLWRYTSIERSDRVCESRRCEFGGQRVDGAVCVSF